MKYLVTVKLPKNAEHDPMNKVIGKCPINGMPCTDVTGQHHTIFVTSTRSAEEIRDDWSKTYHVTRVEMA